MQRPQVTPVAAKGQWVCIDAEFLSTYPVLAQGMCDEWWDDGKKREPWYLSISFTSSAVNVTLVDKGLSQSLYGTYESVIEGLAALENLLSAGATSWRRWKAK